jgi:hypothetical protein
LLHGGQLNPAQGFAQQALDSRVAESVVFAEHLEHCADLALPKAEATQGGEELGLHVERLGLRRVAIFGAIGMVNANAHVGVMFDEELPAMGRSMMRSTYGQQIGRLVLAVL